MKELPFDIKAKLNNYNVIWNTPSENSSGSMPIGNGDIGLNVWVEEGGDICFYIGKTDTWSEATRLLKIGKVRIKLTPNPFVDGNMFIQELKLYESEIVITVGREGQRIKIRIWVDVNQPVIHVEAKGNQSFMIESKLELWRTTEIEMNNNTRHSYYGIINGPVTPVESKDRVLDRTDKIVWLHRNETSFYQSTLDNQHLKGYETRYPDPYINLTFGAGMKGRRLSKVDNYTLRSQEKGTNFLISVYPYTAQTKSVEEWEEQLDNQIQLVSKRDFEDARAEHRLWWSSFWNRSWIFVSGDEEAKAVTQGYLLHRYMKACGGRGKYPIKFNGGIFTCDYEGKDADYREWGSPYWFQNTRLIYWPMIASGDFDMMLPLFKMYKEVLNIQKEVTMQYYKHDGAFYPETMNFYGLYNNDNFGWGNKGVDTNNTYVRYYWGSGLELSAMMLDYYDYTRNSTFATDYLIPIAEQVIKFYDQHWNRINGKIRFYPSAALETYQVETVNPTDIIAGLRYVLPRFINLPKTIISEDQREEWKKCLKRIPNLPLGEVNDKKIIKPAEDYGTPKNNENPELYAIFPYKLYTLGRQDVDLGINTYKNRRVKKTGGWYQDAIHAAYLGLTSDAQKCVSNNFNDYSVRFPSFWNKHFDWMPDFDNGGVAMIALQAMIMQCKEDEIRLLPTWPSSWDVEFKLYAPDNTSVTVTYKDKKIKQLEVNPSSRLSDINIING